MQKNTKNTQNLNRWDYSVIWATELGNFPKSSKSRVVGSRFTQILSHQVDPLLFLIAIFPAKHSSMSYIIHMYYIFGKVSFQICWNILVHSVLRQVFANAVQPNCSLYLTCRRMCRFIISAWSSSVKQKVIFTSIQLINFSLKSIPKELTKQSAIYQSIGFKVDDTKPVKEWFHLCL